MTFAPKEWWTREAGLRDVLRLALPLVLSTASWSLMHFVDRLFLYWHAPEDTAAALSSGTILWTVMALPLGIASYVNAFVAQYYGANRPQQIGRVMFQGIMFGWITVPLFLLLAAIAPWAFSLLGHEAPLLEREVTYFQINSWGAGAAVLAAAYASFYTGRGHTRVVMVIDIFSAIVNAVLDYAWIFGKWGFPEMGIEGAAWATVLSQWIKLVIYGCLLRSPKLRETYGLSRGRKFDADLCRRLLVYGGPNGMQMALEGLAFTVFVIYVARLGTAASAATTLAISVNIVAFVPMIGAGIAVSTLVGQYLGANNVKLATRAVWSGMWLGVAYNAVFAVLYVLAPGIFLAAHRAGGPESHAVVGVAVVLLRFVAAYCLFDAMQLMLCSAIKGAGDTYFVMWTTVSTSVSAIVMLELGISRFGGGLLWCWTVLMLWVFLLAFAYGARFLHGGWKEKRVIEHEATGRVKDEQEGLMPVGPSGTRDP